MMALLLLMSSVFGDNPAAAQGQTPDREMIYSAGLVSDKDPVDHNFDVSNDTKQELRILDARANCGCITLTTIPKSIAPGATAAVGVRMNTRGLHGLATHGVLLRTNHPSKPRILLTISCVVRALWAAPGMIDFGVVDNGLCPTREVLLVKAGLPALNVISVRVAQPDWVKVAWRRPTSPSPLKAHGIEGAAELVVTWIRSSDTQGDARTDLFVTTNNTDFPEVKIPIVAHISGASRVVPPRVVFGPVAPGKSCTREIMVRLDAAVKKGDVQLEASQPFVHASVVASKTDGQTVKLAVTIERPERTDTPLGLVQGRVTGKVASSGMGFSFPYIAMFPR
jgi:hypothetical protein